MTGTIHYDMKCGRTKGHKRKCKIVIPGSKNVVTFPAASVVRFRDWTN
jgi:hypothetical protein